MKNYDDYAEMCGNCFSPLGHNKLKTEFMNLHKAFDISKLQYCQVDVIVAVVGQFGPGLSAVFIYISENVQQRASRPGLVGQFTYLTGLAGLAGCLLGSEVCAAALNSIFRFVFNAEFSEIWALWPCLVLVKYLRQHKSHHH